MQPGPASHADRVAATLANVAAAQAVRPAGAPALPGAGSHDCRIDLKLLQWQARSASERSAAARQRLAEFAIDQRPDLWAGTVRDGTARGFAAALEEAVALAPAAPAETEPETGADPVRTRTLEGRQLRGRKDLLIKSGGARARFTRREGLLFVDRGEQVHSNNCLRFEARSDHGTLDGFVGDDAERPRLYSAQFLQPLRYFTAPGYSRLDLAGRLGRGPVGWHVSMSLIGREADPDLQLDLVVDNGMRDWRLRARFLGMPLSSIHHECADVREIVANDSGGFIAFTLVRACGTLLVDGAPAAAPAAQCLGQLQHRFRLGARHD